MTQPFIGEIRMFAGNFAPKNWAFCNGQILMIAQNTALFSILGTTYGGNGSTTYALPNLGATAPIGAGQGPGLSARALGETGGAAQVTLTTSDIGSHTHALNADEVAGNNDSPAGDRFAQAHVGRRQVTMYASSQGTAQTMNANALSQAGGGQPHNNMPPYLKINFIICLAGIFPSRN
jgi:microcystin-dependent protein